MKNMKKKETFFDYIELAAIKIIEGLKKFSKALLTNKIDDAVKVVLYVIMALISISLLRIPYEIVKQIIFGLLKIVPEAFQYTLSKLISVIYSMVYFTTVLFTIYKFATNLPIPEKYKGKDDKDNISLIGILKLVGIAASVILGLLIALLLIIFTILCITAFDGIYLIGLFITIVGLLITLIGALTLVTKKQYKNFYILLAGFIIIFSGISVLSYETNSFVESTYNNNLSYKEYSYKIENDSTYSFKLNDDTDNIKVVYDDSLNEEIKIVVSYNEDLLEIENSGILKNKRINYNYYPNYSNNIEFFRYVYNIMIDSIKNKETYDLTDMIELKMTIYINENDKNILIDDYDD